MTISTIRKTRFLRSPLMLCAVGTLTFCLIIFFATLGQPLDGEKGSNLAQFLGRFHILVLHAPIIFTFTLLGFLLFRLLSSGHKFDGIIVTFSILTALTSGMTVLLGVLLASSGGFEGDLIISHRNGALWVLALCIVNLIIVTRASNSSNGSICFSQLDLKLSSFVMVLACAFVSITAHRGGSMVHGESYLYEFAPEIIAQHFEEETQDDLSTPLTEPTISMFFEKVRPVISGVCSQCHGASKKEGNVRLDTLSPYFLSEADARTWGHVRDVLNKNEMPPKEVASNLSSAERLDFTNWLDIALAEYTESTRNNSVTLPLRRITKQEYVNTLQDLFNVDASFRNFLPNEPYSTEGYTNNASQSNFTKLHLTQYIETARNALDNYIIFDDAEYEPPSAYLVELEDHRFWTGLKFELAKSLPKPVKSELITQKRESISRGTQTFMDRPLTALPKVVKIGRSFQSDADFMHTKYVAFDTENGVGNITIRVFASGRRSAEGHLPRMRLELGTVFGNNSSLQNLGEYDIEHIYPEVGEYTFQYRLEDLALPREASRGREIEKYPHIRVSNISRHENGIDTGQVFPRYPRSQDFKNAQNPARTIGINIKQHDRTDAAIGKMVEGGVQLIFLDAISIEISPPSNESQWYIPMGDLKAPSTRRTILTEFAESALKRNISLEEIESYSRQYDAAIESGIEPDQALKNVFLSILISPEFLTVPVDLSNGTNAVKLSKYLSYLIWSSPPDQHLISAIEGYMQAPSSEALDIIIKDMIANPKAIKGFRAFGDNWLELHKLSSLTIDPEYYDFFDEDLKKDMAEETYMLISEVLGTDTNIKRLLNPNFAYINDRLSEIYNIGGVFQGNLTRVQTRKRGGLLHNSSLLAINSNGKQAHPIKRAVWIKSRLMATPPPPPPADLDTSIDETSVEFAGKTLREQLELHRTQATCKSCHEKIDPWGVPLQNFDALGAWQKYSRVKVGDTFRREIIETRSTLSSGEDMAGANDLLKKLLSPTDDLFAKGFMHHYASFALNRTLSVNDDAALNTMFPEFADSQYRISNLIRQIVEYKMYGQNMEESGDL